MYYLSFKKYLCVYLALLGLPLWHVGSWTFPSDTQALHFGLWASLWMWHTSVVSWQVGGILVPRPETEPESPCIGKRILNHFLSREIPGLLP